MLNRNLWREIFNYLEDEAIKKFELAKVDADKIPTETNCPVLPLVFKKEALAGQRRYGLMEHTISDQKYHAIENTSSGTTEHKSFKLGNNQ
jgi:hypothetical protein